MAGIFINYRRDDSPGVAGRLGDRLSTNFSHREIFMDVDAMKPGLDFVKQLDEQVAKCDVFLAIIGPSWINAVDEKGRRRLDLPRDYVRVELASALKREIPVIPVLVNGTAMPSEDDLPEDLKSLANRHALELRHTRFAADSEAIIKALNGILPRRRKWSRIAAGVGLALACLFAGIVVWSVQNDRSASRVSDIIQVKPTSPSSTAPKLALAPEARSEVSNAAPALKPPSSSETASMPVAVSTQPSPPTASSARLIPGRIALVIGNARYPDAEAPLKQSVNDARDFAEELRRNGFDVDYGEDLSREAMGPKLNAFYARIKLGSVGVFFFGGFGVQSSRQSYMIPVDAQIWTEQDVRNEGFSLETILGEMNSRGAGVKIALIDASRRNPFERRFRSFSAGLAPVIAPNGTLVMYSAALSSVVVDSGGNQGLFVSELIKQIRVPDLTAEDAFNRTRVGVTRASRSDQVPWISSSLATEFSFTPSAQTSKTR
jgi:hypothetical protein